MVHINNRIVATGVERVEDLTANPRNFRIHPRYQQEAIAGLMDEVGVVARIIVNRRTGFLVDGHLRVLAAMDAGVESLPVAYVDLTDDEEATILATHDKIGGMAVTDPDRLDALLDKVDVSDERLETMLHNLRPQGQTTFDPGKTARPAKQAETLYDQRKVMFGAYRVHLAPDRYLAWKQEMTERFGDDPAQIIHEIKRRLGLSDV